MTDGELVDHLVDDPAIYADATEEENDEERAGFFLFAILAIALPVLIVLGFFLSANPVDDENANGTSGQLESVELTDFAESNGSAEPASDSVSEQTPQDLDIETEVGGATESLDETPVELGDDTAPAQDATSTFLDAGDAPPTEPNSSARIDATAEPDTEITSSLIDPATVANPEQLTQAGGGNPVAVTATPEAVSYTHLTLPTILLV